MIFRKLNNLRLLNTILLLAITSYLHAQHPITFFTATEAAEVKKDISKFPLLNNSFQDIRSEVDAWLEKEVDVPVPKDPAGGYTHDRHKANYMLMFNAGILYNLTGQNKYASFTRQLLLKYAALNPTLGKHPQATSSSPGHLFWQALNDANWLVYAGMAYDLIYPALTPAERTKIEQGAFKPEVDYLTRDLQNWFDLIHNHGVWACAGVGIVGIATNNNDYVEMALYGTKKNKKSGFLAQLDGLFSPDGYYTEGPYYVRYALLPYYLFANALYHARPQLKIFEHRDRILQKALISALQLTNLDGTFYPLNDALKDKDYTSNELVTALSIAWKVYGNDKGLLPVAKRQNRVLLNKGGSGIAAALYSAKDIPEQYPYRSIEYRDGVNGKEGGVSVLRNGTGKNMTSLIFKYSSHGLSHGHFDKLTYNLFDKGNEILTDYGSVRFIGVEQKYGGRYLPENDRYASQTIAHNTVSIDETSHFNGQEKVAEKNHGEKRFSDINGSAVQAASAKASGTYQGVEMERTVYLLQIPGGNRMLVDLFKMESANEHQYDLPFHYNGHLIKTSFRYEPFTKRQETLGNKNGYQYLWKEAQGIVRDSLLQLTFLNHRTYYTVSSLVKGEATVFLTRSGANDPNFNLRHEPAMVIRKKGMNEWYFNVIEIHGKFDPVMEFSTNAYPSVKKMELLRNDDYLVARIEVGEKKLMIFQSNKDLENETRHSVDGTAWKGPFAIIYDGKKLSEN